MPFCLWMNYCCLSFTVDVSLVAHLEFVLKDVLLKTVYNKVPRVLAGPASLELTGSLRYPCSGLARGMPQAVLSVQTGLLMLNIGQENVSCLQQFALIIRKTHEVSTVSSLCYMFLFSTVLQSVM